MKKRFGDSSTVDERWFNSIQNLRFVPNPEDDGEYPLLCERAVNLQSFEDKYITIGTEQSLGSIQLKDCFIVDRETPDAAISSVEAARIISQTGVSTIRSGVGIEITDQGVISLAPTPVLANSVVIGGGQQVVFGESLLNKRGGGDVAIRVTFPTPFLEYPRLLGLHARYVNATGNRFAVISAVIQTRVELLSLTGATIISYWDKGGGGVPDEFSVYYSFIGR